MHWSEEEYQLYLRRRQMPQAASLDTQNGENIQEKEFLARIVRLAKTNSWLYYHTHNSRRSEEGFPDLVLTNGREVLFVELKSATGKLTAAQHRWLDLLTHSQRKTVSCWRPADWPMIEAILTRGDA